MSKLDFIASLRAYCPSIGLAEAKDIADALEFRNVTDGLICGIMSSGRMKNMIRDAVREGIADA